jgi:diamine N-acetyltransferase
MIKLKKANIEDIFALQKICIDAYSLNFYHHWEVGGLEWYLEQEFGLKKLTNDLSNSTMDYFFILQNEVPIGFIKISDKSFIDYSLEEVVELDKIYILPQKKGSGIGKLAMSEIINNVEKRNKKYLFLGVIDTNISAIAFYEKIGFKYHSKTRLDIPFFKEELKGMNKMCLTL